MGEELDDSASFRQEVADRGALAQADQEFHEITWSELKKTIADNDLASLERRPSDIARYNLWTSQIRTAYGSITNFICQCRLDWKPLETPRSDKGPTFACNDPTPFADPEDYTILINDWPYGFTPDVTHLVVWLKTPVPTDPQTGDLTESSRDLINAFVTKTFTQELSREGCGGDRVQWFKNWAQLQSVKGIEHVHILVRDVSREIVAKWVAGRCEQH
ncbi:MAG: hypothetical protein M1812_001194 [Candelaria pacifica]|nr:MAG: hypothetical protein M1812_001194 [Candelaria pacifica]